MTSVELVDSQVMYGLTVAANFPLHQGRPSVASRPDIWIHLGEPAAPTKDRPVGEVLLDFSYGDDPWYTLTRIESGYFFRIYELCDCFVSADLSTMSLHLVHDVDPGVATVLAVGTLSALQLYLRGSLVMHASAVEVGGQVIAVTGHSGMGKSTLSALLCARGARLISDDVLPVELAGNATVRPGATELRLRPGTGLIDSHLVGIGHRTSADQREVIKPESVVRDEPLPLVAILVPIRNRNNRLELERITGTGAVLTVTGFPRLMGWKDPEILSRLLTQVTTLVAQVPVYRAHVPWGPPFDPEIAPMILRELGLSG